MGTPATTAANPPVVHCSNLSPKTTAQDLKALFAPVAVPLKITLRESPSKAVVALAAFADAAECARIVQAFGYHELHGKQMTLALAAALRAAPPEANIFVRNLPDAVNSRDLAEMFAIFGPIVRCMVASDRDGRLLGYGFVHFAAAADAATALATCKNVKVGDNVLEVQAYDPRIKEQALARTDARPAVFTNCFVKHFPADASEARLRALLEKYGEVTSLFLPRRDDGTLVGYACANFAKPAQAAAAIAGLHGQELFTAAEMGRAEGLAVPPFYIQRAEERSARTDALRRQIEKLSLGGQPAKNNLYVSNIPSAFTPDEIKSIFMRFGKIIDFKIMSGAPSTGRMYGYVCYATPEEACVAYEKIDGTYLDGSRLQIAYYKAKDERQAAGLVGPELYAALLAAAEKRVADWPRIRARSAAEFAQHVARGMVRFPESRRILMARNAEELDAGISEVVAQHGRNENVPQ